MSSVVMRFIWAALFYITIEKADTTVGKATTFHIALLWLNMLEDKCAGHDNEQCVSLLICDKE